MQKKAFTLINKGMNRDLSISKAGQSSAYTNKNIRIIARDHDTLLSVTNERGTDIITLSGTTTIVGNLLGWNTLNNYIILFTHAPSGQNPDRIYRVEKNGDLYTNKLLYNGELKFSLDHPIESITYYETENIQKIYWVDGINPLRMMNFKASDSEINNFWDDDYFDSNRWINQKVKAEISKDDSGNVRPNGVVQYLMTYYNDNAQETGYAWMSDLVYLSPVGVGGSADSTNTNRVIIELGADTIANSLDDRYYGIRVYSIFRSSYDGQITAFLVGERTISRIDDGGGAHHAAPITIIDDGAHLSAVDATKLLYLGSQNVIAETMTQKDNTLFLGNLKVEGKDLSSLETKIRKAMFVKGGEQEYDSSGEINFVEGLNWQAKCVEFVYSDGDNAKFIPYVENTGSYPYENQLLYSSSTITTFKGGEKYRFGLMFRLPNGVNTETFWIGDLVNPLYPVIDVVNKRIKRSIAKCTIPVSVMRVAYELGLSSVQLMIAEATYADRAIKAQGLINPTVFNVWNRASDRLYAAPSWVSRPRNSTFAYKHFEPIHNATSSTGEIQCNYWETNDAPNPYYRLKNYDSSDSEYMEEFDADAQADYMMVLYSIRCASNQKYHMQGFVIRANLNNASAESDLYSFVFANNMFYTTTAGTITITQPTFSLTISSTHVIEGERRKEKSYTAAMTNVCNELKSLYNVNNPSLLLDKDIVSQWATSAKEDRQTTYYYNWKYPSTSDKKTSISAAANIGTGTGRWFVGSMDEQALRGAQIPSYRKKHLFFVDENTVTLDSPEIAFEAVSINTKGGTNDYENPYKLRIIGVAKIDNCISDCTVDASQGMLSGNNFVNENFSGFGANSYIDGLITWPLWEEYSLQEREANQDSGYTGCPDDFKERTSEDYLKPHGSHVRYWLYMWNHVGIIDGYTDTDVTIFDGDAYSKLKKKVFANMRYAYRTSYVYTGNGTIGGWTSNLESVRLFNYTSSQYVGIKTNGKGVYYDGVINDAVSMPGSSKYPIFYSASAPTVGEEQNDPSKFLYISDSVPITYASGPHIVMSLPTIIGTDTSSLHVYKQTVLPSVEGGEGIVLPKIDIPTRNESDKESGALIPWLNAEDNYVNFAYNDSDYTDGDDDYYVPDYVFITDNSKEDTISLVINSAGLSGQHGPVVPATPSDELNFVVKTWNPAIAYFGGGTEVYVWLKAYISGVDKTGMPVFKLTKFLVDISNYRIEDTYYIKIDNAKCIRASSQSEVNVRFAKYSTGEETPSTNPANFGYGKLNVSDKTVTTTSGYKYIDYTIDRTSFTLNPNNVNSANVDTDPTEYERYFFVGEVFQDFDSDPLSDTRYGGITFDAIENCRFMPSGKPQIINNDYSILNYRILYGDEGDTYFQRYDALRTKPYSPDCENSVIDLTSAMVETHINIDGRTDLQRGIRYIASLDEPEFNKINRVYSQPNNFIVGRDLKRVQSDDTYSSTITWTPEKHDAAETDEWMHITLASNLKLDGERGNCNALRRFQNSIIAFQDRSISEILFNSRTQIPTGDGVPIEIANSGKVDGKRVITNNSGCINKWSIVEGKNALYYVDNINKAFYAFNGNLENLSEKLGFTAWFKEKNKMGPWKPSSPFNNFASYFDRVHSDVYLVGGDADEPCLVYNETLGVFTSFFDYANVPMMTNVGNEFISFYGSSLYRQNRGKYNYFFNAYKPFSVMYRVTPDPFGDKIWSNIEYRADFYDVNPTGTEVKEEGLIDGGAGDYKKDSTFDAIRVWNEYQTTGTFTGTEDKFNNGRIDKRFRIWRCQIPRAYGSQYGLDRIRNPWVNVEFKKAVPGTSAARTQYGEELMQLHDATIIYYE